MMLVTRPAKTSRDAMAKKPVTVLLWPPVRPLTDIPTNPSGAYALPALACLPDNLWRDSVVPHNSPM
jgi:hypothetical protein